MPASHDAAIARAVTMIRRYLDAHPHAADSAEGIAHWWLARQRFDETVETVEQALRFLVATGEITQTVTGDGKFVYLRAKRK